jgi:auxin influx carrier (AUX1 LAX family)
LRVLNIVALFGTTFTSLYIINTARVNGYADRSSARLWPAAVGVTTAPQYFFTGCAVLLNALGGHSIMIEMLEVMDTPKQFTTAYSGGWLWTILLVVPHSLAVNLSYPFKIGGSDNVYGVLPMSHAKVASVALMVMHQLAAFAYYVVPALYMWERIIGTHNKHWAIRLPSRLPVSLLIWLAAMAFPFYGAINSLMASVSVPFTSYALPCLTFIIIYYKSDARVNAILPPFRWLRAANWTPVFVLAVITCIVFAGFGFAAIAYSILSIVQSAQTYGVFARCYQCAANYVTLLKDAGNNM